MTLTPDAEASLYRERAHLLALLAAHYPAVLVEGADALRIPAEVTEQALQALQDYVNSVLAGLAERLDTEAGLRAIVPNPPSRPDATGETR